MVPEERRSSVVERMNPVNRSLKINKRIIGLAEDQFYFYEQRNQMTSAKANLLRIADADEDVKPLENSSRSILAQILVFRDEKQLIRNIQSATSRYQLRPDMAEDSFLSSIMRDSYSTQHSF